MAGTNKYLLFVVNLFVWFNLGCQYCGVQIVWGPISPFVSFLTCGSSFQAHKVKRSGYFQTISEWCLVPSGSHISKYNIDFLPDIENGDVCESLLFQHEALFGKCHTFDGNSLLLPHPLPKSVK